MAKGYNDFYRQFEELNKKLDKANNTIFNMSLTIAELNEYWDNHFLFLKKFFVPFSNNRAESDLRGIKIKQKTGKFRSVEGANTYAVIKSYISTYAKNGINLYKALTSVFTDSPILI